MWSELRIVVTQYRTKGTQKRRRRRRRRSKAQGRVRSLDGMRREIPTCQKFDAEQHGFDLRDINKGRAGNARQGKARHSVAR